MSQKFGFARMAPGIRPGEREGERRWTSGECTNQE